MELHHKQAWAREVRSDVGGRARTTKEFRSQISSLHD